MATQRKGRMTRGATRTRTASSIKHLGSEEILEQIRQIRLLIAKLRSLELTEEDRSILASALARMKDLEEAPYKKVLWIRIDPDLPLLTVDDHKIDLLPIEHAILQMLLVQPGVKVSRNLILETLFSDDRKRADRIVNVYVSRIRRKLFEVTGRRDLISFDRRRGDGWSVQDSVHKTHPPTRPARWRI